MEDDGNNFFNVGEVNNKEIRESFGAAKVAEINDKEIRESFGAAY